MIAPDSPLLNLPVELNRKQKLFLDGMRHAAEIADFAYNRLTDMLTSIAHHARQQKKPPSFTPAFLDAWAVVDAIDRFRGLLHLMPGHQEYSQPAGEPSFREQTQCIRDLRNVGDHVAERVDQIVKMESTALGILSWYTAISPSEGICCAIIPGTIMRSSAPLPNPMGRRIALPTDMITLSAGEHVGSLSEAIGHLRLAVRSLEAGLATWIVQAGFQGKQAGADVLIAGLMKFDSSGTH